MTQATSYETLDVAIDGGVATVTISNPPMNVINLAMARDLGALVDTVSRNGDVRVVLFRSATEGVFIAGADISVLADPEKVAELKDYADVLDRVARLPQPTVCALAGTALGGGFEFALACDFRLMADGYGEVGLPEVRLGVLPGWGGTQRLPRLVGAGVATEMIMKGMRYQPQQALELGLVHRVVPAAELDAEAAKYASSLARQAPLALQGIKRAIRAAFETPGDAGLAVERDEFAKVVQSNDAREGLTAFLEGRKPDFSGS